MTWIDSITSDLPAPRDDEPSSLRDDILAELADHLQTAAAREQLRGNSPEEARSQALRAFGDPAAVARQLWLDAMKGKIMTQKLLIALSLLLSMLSIAGMCLIVWSTAQSRALQAATTEQQLQLLRQIVEMKNAPSPSMTNPSWNPLKLRLEYQGQNGPPLSEITVYARLPVGPGGKIIDVQRKSDKDGVVNLGFVPPGNIEYYVLMPWKEFTNRNVTVLPGEDHQEIVVCPAEAPGMGNVRFECEISEELKSKDVFYQVEFFNVGRKIAGGVWSLYEKSPWTSNAVKYMSVTLGPRGQLIELPTDHAKLVDLPSVRWPEGNWRAGPLYIIQRGAERDRALFQPMTAEDKERYKSMGPAKFSPIVNVEAGADNGLKIAFALTSSTDKPTVSPYLHLLRTDESGAVLPPRGPSGRRVEGAGAPNATPQ